MVGFFIGMCLGVLFVVYKGVIVVVVFVVWLLLIGVWLMLEFEKVLWYFYWLY